MCKNRNYMNSQFSHSVYQVATFPFIISSSTPVTWTDVHMQVQNDHSLISRLSFMSHLFANLFLGILFSAAFLSGTFPY